MRVSYRAVYFICFLLSIILMVTAFYLEYTLNISPCLLCLLQRFILGILVILFFLAIIRVGSVVSRTVLTIAVFVFSLLGILAASRQVWLQHVALSNPNAPTSCLPNVAFLLRHFPITDVIKLTVTGSAECSHIDWTLFGISLAKLSLLFFIFFFIVSIRQFFSKDHF